MSTAVSLNMSAGRRATWLCSTSYPPPARSACPDVTAVTISNATTNQVSANGQTVLTLGDQTQIQLAGTTRADASFLG
jgi:hypothetical protein